MGLTGFNKYRRELQAKKKTCNSELEKPVDVVQKPIGKVENTSTEKNEVEDKTVDSFATVEDVITSKKEEFKKTSTQTKKK